MTTLLESRKHGPKLWLRLKDGDREWWEVIPRRNVIRLWPYVPAIGFRLETGQVQGVTASKAAAAQLARLARGTDALWGIREWGKELPKGETAMTTHIQPATTATIPFHGSALRVKEEAGEIWVAVKPICEHLGIDWKNQHAKLVTDARFSCGDITMTAADGKNYAMTALNQNELLGWLYTINPNKVKAAARPLLLAYQKETTQAINDYWTKGQAVRPNVAPAADPMLAQLEVMTKMRQTQLEQEQRLSELEQRVDAAPIAIDPGKAKVIKELVQAWARCMKKGRASFGLAYRAFYDRFDVPNYQALPSNRFDEATEFLRLQIKAYGGHVPDRLL